MTVRLDLFRQQKAPPLLEIRVWHTRSRPTRRKGHSTSQADFKVTSFRKGFARSQSRLRVFSHGQRLFAEPFFVSLVRKRRVIQVNVSCRLETVRFVQSRNTSAVTTHGLPLYAIAISCQINPTLSLPLRGREQGIGYAANSLASSVMSSTVTVGAGPRSIPNKASLRKPLPTGINLPRMTFSFNPRN